MSVFKVHVKWGKEKYKDLECNTEEPPLVFKAQLFALTGVEPNRQKVMLKGTVLKDTDWGTFKLKDGATLLMMGTKEALPEAPVEKTLFIEDLTEEELASALEFPAGLSNLGNTCYMNATVQCLRSVPELKEALRKYSGDPRLTATDTAVGVVAAMRDLFVQLDQKSEGFPPFVLLQRLHAAFPHFADRTEQGVFQQQDANECWIQITRMLQQKLPSITDAGEPMEVDGGASSTNKGFMDQYFRGEFDTTLKCIEAEDEKPTNSKESFFQLSCYIDHEVRYMHTGLQSRLSEHIEKNSPSLERNAQYIKESKLSRLPAYLTIQMVRFQYKEKESINAKILKDVKFPMTLDVWDLCSETLQEKLVPMRDKFKIMEDKKTAEAQKAKQEGKKVKLQSEVAVDEDAKYLPFEFSDDKGSNNSGYYELQAVLTHQGRSSSSGHYVGWVKRKGDEWIKFDDDDVSPVTAEDILRLSGGGDWHCAYVLLYGPRSVEEKYLTEEGKESATVES
ncbi:ubiquitin carboxyl-terminal hydrolase 14-like [Apostichopus japonicus]|uniref:ubiquitin carboxyl-terminal hydrolase 14-like n=1 Tax=Stichopus japonicus TaxID=307972 RepID=UPI003AB1BD2F